MLHRACRARTVRDTLLQDIAMEAIGKNVPFDDKLVRERIKGITVYKEYVTVELMSGEEVRVER